MSLDWKNWCRLCAKMNGNEFDIFVNIEAITDFKSIIQSQFNIFITNSDNKPPGVCNNCFQYILNFKQFCDRCIRSNKMYDEILYNSNINDLENIKIKYELNENTWNSLDLNDSFTKSENIDLFDNKTKIEDDENINLEGLQNVQVELLNEVENSDNLIPATSSKSDSSSKKSAADAESIKIANRKRRNKYEEGIFKCEECDKIYTKRSNYQYHLKTKHANIKLFCSKCPKFFTTNKLLKTHEKVHLPDSEKMIHTCSYCNKKFSKAVNVKTHIKTIHINEREFVCDECGNGFKTKAALQHHQLSHTDERPFQCPDCPKRFKSMANLYVHSDHHSNTKYPCPKCGTVFNTKKSLRGHMVVHKDEKKYKCEFCGKGYKRYITLKDHLNTHTGYRYPCPYCDNTFAYRMNCRNHQKAVHPVEFAASLLEAKQQQELKNK